MSFAETPILHNRLVRLEPLAPDHRDDLADAVGDLHRAWYTSVPSPEGMSAEIDRRLSLQAQGLMAPWAVVDAASGRAVGMTTMTTFDEPNRRVEIGYTWLGRAAHGTGVNPAAKLLLLERAFDQLGCIVVQFLTHWHNHQSRAAIARLGAKQDGVLRNHRILPNGTVRDTVVFSILDTEWPSVRAGLEHRIGG
ncbi:GNAT family N-acetyltransferase [Microbacterium marinilacus]|uniref:GNAT family protein n=1 Tax=Microbacterium marinilacus TaxID=415209 RepID=A0ABP7B8R3_9MICO|nr:GNAT family protein [Microbacterium marinilacus]MBY0687483.1 GNAT family N-acetyltransferase [Microbacterium marinilacus]